jgi:hypothetical protein
MAGQRLGFLGARPAAGQVGNELVPQRVKIKHPAGLIGVRQKVGLDPRLFLFVRFRFVDPCLTRGCQVGGQHFRSAVGPGAGPQSGRWRAIAVQSGCRVAYLFRAILSGARGFGFQVGHEWT